MEWISHKKSIVPIGYKILLEAMEKTRTDAMIYKFFHL